MVEQGPGPGARPIAGLTQVPGLRQIGEIMRIMGRLDVAQARFERGLAGVCTSAEFTQLQHGVGGLGRPGPGPVTLTAPARCSPKIARAKAMGQIDQEIEGQLGLARALMGVQRMDEASLRFHAL